VGRYVHGWPNIFSFPLENICHDQRSLFILNRDVGGKNQLMIVSITEQLSEGLFVLLAGSL
jgi:hypothetical protein